MVKQIDLAYIPGGHFIMGSDDPMAMQDEGPIHKVYIDEFWMTQTPITNKQLPHLSMQLNMSQQLKKI